MEDSRSAGVDKRSHRAERLNQYVCGAIVPTPDFGVYSWCIVSGYF